MNYRNLFHAALAGSFMLGYAGTSSAVSCIGGLGDTSDLILSGMEATSCGTGITTQDFTPDIIADWTVNDPDELIPMSGEWLYYEREEENMIVDTTNLHDGNTTAIGLSSTEIGDNINSGELWITNAFDPFLIVLKSDQNNYQWYMYEGKAGELHGTWDAGIFDGQDLSHITIYTKVVPVPAAVWLFGSGLIGLAGIARRKRTS